MELKSNCFSVLFHVLFSFSVIVVFLKVLLNQQGLDKPFTGGLGSYALYVLVASHVSIRLWLVELFFLCIISDIVDYGFL